MLLVAGQLIFHSKYSSSEMIPDLSCSFLRHHSRIKSFYKTIVDPHTNWWMCWPVIVVIVTDSSVVRCVGLSRIPDKLEKVEDISVILIKPEECKHDLFSGSGFCAGQVNAIDIHDFRHRKECVFFRNTIPGFVLCNSYISIFFIVSSFSPRSRCVKPLKVRIRFIFSPNVIKYRSPFRIIKISEISIS